MADVVTRVRYFDHQFLQVGDFTDEQNYHRELLQLHNASLHTPGIAQGLDVTFATGATKVSVSPGVAIDGTGMQLVLATERDVELASFTPDATVYLVISYAEQPAVPATDGSGNDTRTTEIPDIEGETSAPQDGQHLLLAAVTRSGTAVTGIDTTGRLVAGAAGGDESVQSLAIRAANAVPANWPTLTAPAASQAELSSSLTIDGALTAGGQNSSGATIDGSLTVTGAASVESLTWGTGSLLRGGAGGQGGSIELGGNENVPGVGTPFIDFHFQGKQEDFNARIINDADGRLSIIAGTTRFTGSIAGPLTVTGGAITPAVGNSPNAGIEFPTNPGGGGGDEAFIRYYVDTGAPGATPETTRLVIGINNDADDRLGLFQFGAERLTISGGNVGINEQNPQHVFQVTSGSEVHSGGTGAGFSFANRSFNNGALQDNPSPGNIGSRWVWYAFQGPTWPGGPANPGQAWLWSGGNLVSVATNGNIGVRGLDANVGLPNGWGGGVHTFDLYSDGGTIAAGRGGSIMAALDANGNMSAKTKPFVIDHPLDDDRQLIHAALEGPEHGVFYRGQARLQDGKATIELPRYFEALCRTDDRSVQVTPLVQGDGSPGILGVTAVTNGQFDVVAASGTDQDQSFFWEVKAVRADVDEFDPEPIRGTSPLAPGPTPEDYSQPGDDA